MKTIPEAIVEKIWQEVAGFTPDRAKKELMKIDNSQPELLAFVAESTQEMSQEVREFAIYMFVVVYVFRPFWTNMVKASLHFGAGLRHC